MRMEIDTPADETAEQVALGADKATAGEAAACAAAGEAAVARPTRLLGRSLRFGSFVGNVISIRHCKGQPAQLAVQWKQEFGKDARCKQCKRCKVCSKPWDALEDDLTIEEVQSRLSPKSPLQQARIPGKIRKGEECAAHCKLDQGPHSHPLTFSTLHSLAGIRLLYLPSRPPQRTPQKGKISIWNFRRKSRRPCNRSWTHFDRSVSLSRRNESTSNRSWTRFDSSTLQRVLSVTCSLLSLTSYGQSNGIIPRWYWRWTCFNRSTMRRTMSVISSDTSFAM